MDESRGGPPAEALLALNRAATAARLMAGVVHEVNNALQVISGSVELLESRPDLPAALKPGLARVRAQSARAAAVMADAQRFTRAPVHDRAPVNLREVAQHSLDLRAFSTRRLGLATRLDAPDGGRFVVRGNRAQIQQVVLNLIGNAELALAERKGEILVQLHAAEGWVMLRVADEGPGITMQPRERIFEPFASTRDPWDGAGLGLWAARAIAAEHGGSLTLEDTPAGASFVLYLPAPGEPDDSAAGDQARASTFSR